MKEPLYELAEGIRRCTSCPLWKKRLLPVPGEGKIGAKLMFIGEAPGAEEDKQGVAFVGPSGKFLYELLEKNKIKKEACFFTSAVKCHPDKNRKPTEKEICTCRELWLKKQIDVIKPEMIVLLGQTAIDSVIGKGKVKDYHGKLFMDRQYKLFVTYHPSAAKRFPKIKKLMEEDLMKLSFYTFRG
ncbi:MAG: uracil-DNA glycosylase [Candidatus Woesearchaeota archaeon]|jgi:DNA polymerase